MSEALQELTCTNLYGKTFDLSDSPRKARGVISSVGENADFLRDYPNTGCILLS